MYVRITFELTCICYRAILIFDFRIGSPHVCEEEMSQLNLIPRIKRSVIPHKIGSQERDLMPQNPHRSRILKGSFPLARDYGEIISWEGKLTGEGGRGGREGGVIGGSVVFFFFFFIHI